LVGYSELESTSEAPEVGLVSIPYIRGRKNSVFSHSINICFNYYIQICLIYNNNTDILFDLFLYTYN